MIRIKLSIGAQAMFKKMIMSFLFLMFNSNILLAEFQACNNTKSDISLAMSIHDKWTQTSEGWWIIEPEECEVLFTSTAKNKKVLVHISEVSDSTSIWGEVTESICGQTKLFLVNYIDECPDGYDRYPAFQLLTQGVENVILNLEEDKSINYQY